MRESFLVPVTPPRPATPHLNALRAFEAAARLNSISAAADELGVTPGAVAQQVKSLEAWAGKKLFKRNAQGVELSPLGASVLNEFTDAFDALGVAVQKLRMKAAPQEIRIAALPSIAQLWLSPRLPEIRRAMPEISVSVTALENPPNLVREPYDFAIFYSDGDDPANAVSISQDVIYPVCSPALARRLKSVADLESGIFLTDSTWKDDWKTWLTKAAPGQFLNHGGPEFSLYALAVEECKNGAGVLIGHEALVRNLIESGELVVPFDIRIDLPRNLTLAAARPSRPGSILDRIAAKLMDA